ncbi:MAG: 5'-methylthioadenosine/adenosylhomocysteine nucleosidase [Hydrogenibacillus schlegelii]|nr:5'-methylthioadenosine/adenosylhomocysteine nucleosidase [Hydrogenibacillus schlegelii]
MVAIIGAMDEEIAELLQGMDAVDVRRAGPVEARVGRMDGRPVAVLKSGVGKVNAALAVQAVIDHLRPQALLFLGVAGALDPALEIGDLVVAEDALQHDVDATPLGFRPGEIPFEPASVFPADPRLIRRAVTAAEALFGRRPAVGRVLSGDRFVADREMVKALRERFGGLCVEMEGAAAAQVAHKNGVPFLLIRTISDRADGAAPADFPAFLKEAAGRSAALARAIVRSAEEFEHAF